jgi:hypothetical protein
MAGSRKGAQARGVDLPPAPRQHTARIVRSDGGETTRYTDGLRTRVETEKHGLPRRIRIHRPDLGVVWTIHPEVRQYSEREDPSRQGFQMMDPDQEMIWDEAGIEVIDGKTYTRYHGKLRGTSGQSLYVRILDPRTGERRRAMNFGTHGQLALTVDTYMEIGPPDPSVFELPTGLEKVGPSDSEVPSRTRSGQADRKKPES